MSQYVSACFYRMLRGPPVLVWACPLRSTWLLREFHLFASSEHVGSTWLEVRHEQISEKGAKTLRCSARLHSLSNGGEKFRLEGLLSENSVSKAILKSHYHHPQVSAKTKVAPYLFSTFWDCLINRTFWPWVLSHTTCNLINKRRCNFLQNCLRHNHCSVGSFNIRTLNPWILNQPHLHSVHQIRTVHQAARRVADTWRDCLSSENEERCRHILQANWKHYDMDKVRKGASQAQGRNKGKWASILVSLCYDQGGPAFLFTLRSCTLKGKHKGDVRLVGGW